MRDIFTEKFLPFLREPIDPAQKTACRCCISTIRPPFQIAAKGIFSRGEYRPVAAFLFEIAIFAKGSFGCLVKDYPREHIGGCLCQPAIVGLANADQNRTRTDKIAIIKCGGRNQVIGKGLAGF